jgi:hypothetical protein
MLSLRQELRFPYRYAFLFSATALPPIFRGFPSERKVGSAQRFLFNGYRNTIVGCPPGRLANRKIRALPYLHTKAGGLDAQQVQQLVISMMKYRPAHLRLYGFELPLQLFPGHAFTRASPINGALTVPKVARTRILLLPT